MQHTFRVSEEEEKILNALCFHLERNLADTVRFAIRKLAREEGLVPKKPKPYIGEMNGKREKETV